MVSPEEEMPIDLESSSQIELDRTPGCDSDSVLIDSRSVESVPEPHHRARVKPGNRELQRNQFPPDA